MENNFQLDAASKDLNERAKAYHEACLAGFKQQMGYAFLAGLVLTEIKASVKHGEFEDYCEAHLPEIKPSSRKRYMKFFELLSLQLPQKAHAVGFLPAAGKEGIPKETEQKILKAVYQAADGKTLTELYRDLGVIREKQPEGGFRPPNEAVQEWLKKHHPELAGTKYADLPEKLQRAFKKQYRPKPIPAEMIAEAERARLENSYDRIVEERHDKSIKHAEPKFLANYRQLLKDYIADMDKCLRTATTKKSKEDSK